MDFCADLIEALPVAEAASMPLAERSGRRLSWLSINIVLNMISVSVIAFFE